jgi:AhpD family alkylhydroperoxidase
MAKDWVALAKEVNSNGMALYKKAPGTMGAFSKLAAAATADGALDKKTKELMAVAIAIVDGCEGCIAYHTQAAIKAGATEAEFLETIGVAIEMGGGPATVYGGQALEAYAALSAG